VARPNYAGASISGAAAATAFVPRPAETPPAPTSASELAFGTAGSSGQAGRHNWNNGTCVLMTAGAVSLVALALLYYSLPN
jgi:hypothetical protein